MPDQLQLRGGTTTEHNSFTGAAREVTVDTTKKTLVVHDGSQAGGTPLMKESGGNAASTVSIGTGGNNVINISTGQKVGIGTASPANLVNLAAGSGDCTLQLSRNNASSNGNTYGNLLFTSDTNVNVARVRGVRQSAANNAALVFDTAASGSLSEKMRIQPDGKIGIGTTSPIYPLDVTGSIRATSQGRFGNGTASEPAYSFSGDSDTGMYRSTTNILAFSTAGGERVKIDAVGNVTINGGQSLFFHNGFNDSTSRIQNAGASNNSTLRFLTRENGTEGERMVITSGGAVGIGVSGPSGACKLEIGGKLMFSGLDTAFVSSARPAVFRTGSTSGSYPFNNFGHLVLQSRGDGSNRDIVFATGSNGAFKTVVTSTGNVGIGNTSPVHKLEVTQSAPILAIRATSASSSSTGKIQFVNLDGNSNYRDVCQIEGKSSGNGGYGDLIFKTQFNNSLINRLKIDKQGRVGIGQDDELANYDASADRLVVGDGSADEGITIVSGQSVGHHGSIYFADGQGATNSKRGQIRYEQNTEAMKFATAGSERLRITSTGDIGVGTSSPDGLLHVVNNNAFDTKVIIESTATNSYPTYSLKNDARQYSLQIDGATDNLRIYDTTATAERITLTPSGNVGIGHDSPSSFSSSANTLVVSETTGNAGISIHAAAANASSSVFFVDGTGSGANGIGRIIYSHQDDSMAFWASGAQGMLLMRDGSHHELFLNTATQLAGATLSVHTNGTCGIGLKVSADNTQKHIAFANTNGEVGSITTNGSATSYQTSSDYRLKENAVAIADGITRLKTLIPYRFNFKSDPSTKVDGFFAHEVTAVPEAVTGTKDEVDSNNNPIYQGIDQSKLVPLLVAAVKELIGKVEALEAA